MKIRETEAWVVQMKLSEPYTIAYETIDHADNVFIRISTHDGITGFGCAAPDPEVTEETSKSVMHCFRHVIEPILKDADPLCYIKLIEKLKHHIPEAPSAIAMVDMALYDIMAKKAGIPVYKLLGGYRSQIRTSITIGIMPVQEMINKALEHKEKGFKVLKIKGGRNVEDDIERIITVREAVGKEIKIRFDANQGYSVEEAIRFFRETKNARVELLEQPTRRDEMEKMGIVSKKVAIPVMADESLMNLRDVFRMAKRELTDMINIKLMKVGGISEALHINSVARAAGFEVMVGCMDESELGISAGLHFALARPNVIYADLDGHLDLVDDPARGSVILKDGVLYPKNIPGLGWEV